MNAMKSHRFMTYNVRHGQGVLWPVSLSRTARTIATHRPHVVALNELYRLPGRYDQPALLARKLKMNVAFQPVHKIGKLEYGNAILSREPLDELTRLDLPRRVEGRGLLIAETSVEGTRTVVAATHLSLHRETRREQVDAIVGALDDLPKGPTALFGDFNCGHCEIDPLLQRLSTAEKPPATYPSLLPFAVYDHILWSDHWELENISAVRSLASDHLPLIADLNLSPRG